MSKISKEAEQFKYDHEFGENKQSVETISIDGFMYSLRIESDIGTELGMVHSALIIESIIRQIQNMNIDEEKWREIILAIYEPIKEELQIDQNEEVAEARILSIIEHKGIIIKPWRERKRKRHSYKDKTESRMVHV